MGVYRASSKHEISFISLDISPPSADEPFINPINGEIKIQVEIIGKEGKIAYPRRTLSESRADQRSTENLEGIMSS